jgi:hypothetical protein
MVANHGGTLVLRRPAAGESPAGSVRQGDCPFQFRYRVPGLLVLIGGEEQPDVQLRGTEASLDILDPAATAANLRFEGGSMALAGWGEFAVKFASLQFEPGGLRVGNVRLAPGKDSPGEIELLNPDEAILDLHGGTVTLAVRLHRTPATFLLGSSFGHWMQMEIETPEGGQDGTFEFNSNSPSAIACRIPFRATPSSESRCVALPMLGVIARETGESWYQTPRFDLEASGTLARQGAVAGLEDLRLESRNRLTVTGQVTADAEGNLNGVLEVGLPDATVNEARAAFRNVFKRRDGGLSWATVRISGTGRQPQDDLQKQLEAAATLSPATGAGTDSLEDAFRELTRPEEER